MPRPILFAFVLAIPSLAWAGVAPADENAWRQRLLRLSDDGERTTEVTLPVAANETSIFQVRDSGTLPRALARRFPGLRSFRGMDAQGRTIRLDLSGAGLRASIRDGAREWLIGPGQLRADAAGTAHTNRAIVPAPRRMLRATSAPTAQASGGVRYDFRLAVAASSRYVAAFGGTVEGALGGIVHAINLANEVFETDVGVHFTLVDRNDRIVLAHASRDPFRTSDPGPAAMELIERKIGGANYDVGHALTTLLGGESEVGTSCNDDRGEGPLPRHKAAAWSGHPHPESDPDAIGFLIHVLGRQLGAWPTANGCVRATLGDRAVEPGSGSTAMGFAPMRCGGEGQWLQPRSDLYFHTTSIGQMQSWLGSRGGRCASKRVDPFPAPWIDPVPLAEDIVVPARTPFALDASAEPAAAGSRLTYAWEQIDTGPEQHGVLVDDGLGPIFRSFPPVPSGRRVFPRMAAVLGHETAAPGETLPTTSRRLNFRLTVRDHGGEHAAVAGAGVRVRVVDTGRPFAVLSPGAATRAPAGSGMTIRWDVAGTTQEPISCHFVAIDLSVDGGWTWPGILLAADARNDGEARITLPDVATTQARIRVRCDWRPFFAISPADFTISAR